MSALLDIIRKFCRGALLLLLAMCVLFWLLQVVLFSLRYFRGGWDGVESLIWHVMLLNKDPSEWDRWGMKDFILAELFWFAFTVALVVANRRILRQIVHELKGVMRPNRNSRSSEPDEIGRVG
jgi:hypothetical protein